MGTEPTVVAAVVVAGVVVGPDGMAVLVPWLMEPVTPGAEVETVRDVAAEGRPVDPQPKVMARVTKESDCPDAGRGGLAGAGCSSTSTPSADARTPSP